MTEELVGGSWYRVWDDTNQAYYLWNETTGESEWESEESLAALKKMLESENVSLGGSPGNLSEDKGKERQESASTPNTKHQTTKVSQKDTDTDTHKNNDKNKELDQLLDRTAKGEEKAKTAAVYHQKSALPREAEVEKFKRWYEEEAIVDAAAEGESFVAPRLRRGPPQSWELWPETMRPGKERFVDRLRERILPVEAPVPFRMPANPHLMTRCNFSYQDFGDKYQYPVLLGVLNKLVNCEVLVLQHNGLRDLSKAKLPRLRHLDIGNNEFFFFKELPRCPKLVKLSANDNNIGTFRGCRRYFSNLQELKLLGNPIAYRSDYRERCAFQSASSLTVLDESQLDRTVVPVMLRLCWILPC